MFDLLDFGRATVPRVSRRPIPVSSVSAEEAHAELDYLERLLLEARSGSDPAALNEAWRLLYLLAGAPGPRGVIETLVVRLGGLSAVWFDTKRSAAYAGGADALRAKLRCDCAALRSLIGARASLERRRNSA